MRLFHPAPHYLRSFSTVFISPYASVPAVPHSLFIRHLLSLLVASLRSVNFHFISLTSLHKVSFTSLTLHRSFLPSVTFIQFIHLNCVSHSYGGLFNWLTSFTLRYSSFKHLITVIILIQLNSVQFI